QLQHFRARIFTQEFEWILRPRKCLGLSYCGQSPTNCARSRLDKASKRSQSSTVSLSLNRNLFSLAAPRALAAIGSLIVMVALPARAQELPSLINVVDYSKLLPLLPDAPAGWTAEKAEGSTTDV